MVTYKFTLAYDGTKYAGWQVQENATAIQELCERAVAKITGEHARVTASGRTDAGVHALAQVASCQMTTRLDTGELLSAINGNLPFDVRVTNVAVVADNFDPIRDTVRKSYRYVIQDGRIHDVFQLAYSWFVPGELDVLAMQQGASHLIGRHDFSSFQSAGSKRLTTIRHVDRLTVARRSDSPHFIDFDISSDGFLYNMVRIIVGTLVEVGRGGQTADWVRTVRDARDRQAAGPTAPPHGLFLVSVEYPSS